MPHVIDHGRSAGGRFADRVLHFVIPQLAQGFLEDPQHRRGVEEQAAIFEASVTLLYRLLFVLFAESRELLPLGNAKYRAVSLQNVVDEIAREAGVVESEIAGRIHKTYSPEKSPLYLRIARLFHALAAGDPKRNLPAYGGLFGRDAPGANFLREHRVPDRFLAFAMDALAREVDERTQTLVAVDYASLDVRLLGSIYESLLEFKLVVVEETARIVKRGVARKASGSFYTPEPIVRDVVAHTVGPVLDEKLQALEAEFRVPGASPRADLIDRLFDMRVLDPAMGSGNFLVEVVDFMADRLCRFLEPCRVRGLADLHQIRRLVLKNCIFGVDLNPMAVEVAKVTLWLHAGTRGDSLTFLNDHLRCGNSLVGDTLRDLDARGFDGIVGNPPFLDKKQIVRHLSELDAYWKGEFQTARGIYDVYMLFLEQATRLIPPGGRFGLVTPIPWLTQAEGAALRDLLRRSGELEIVNFANDQHFAGALVKVVAVLLRKGPPHGSFAIRERHRSRPMSYEVAQEIFQGQFRLDVSEACIGTLRKIASCSRPLRAFYTPTFGLRACSRERGAFTKQHFLRPREQCARPVPYLESSELDGDRIRWRGRWLDYQPALIYSPRSPELFLGPKLLVPSLMAKKRIRAVFDERGFFADQSLVCISAAHALPELSDVRRPSLHALRVQLNSMTISYYFAHAVVGEALGGGAIHATPGLVGALPSFCQPEFEHATAGNIDAMIGDICELKARERRVIAAWHKQMRVPARPGSADRIRGNAQDCIQG